MKSNYISLRKYIISFTIIIMIILLSVYAYRWYDVYIKEQTRESYLIKTNTTNLKINRIEDLNSINTEASNGYFIFISYKHSKDVLNLEKKLKTIIDDYGINDSFYYLDMTSNMKNQNYINELNTQLNTTSLEELPAIIYVKYNSISNENILTSTKNKIVSASQFEDLLKKNYFEKISQ